MATKFKISSKREEVFIDPNLLFQRVTTIEKNSKVSLKHLFKFELSWKKFWRYFQILET